MKNKKKLKKIIKEMIASAKKAYPKVEYIVIPGGNSGQDATVEFFSPARYEDSLDKALRDITYDALINDNLFISALTLTKRVNNKKHVTASS